MCSKFTGEHPSSSVISIKLQSNFIEITFRHGCSPVTFLHIFRTPFHKNVFGVLLLYYLFLKFCHLNDKKSCWPKFVNGIETFQTEDDGHSRAIFRCWVFVQTVIQPPLHLGSKFVDYRLFNANIGTLRDSSGRL